MARNISEKNTRKEMIDPQLEKAGWYLRDHSKVKIEIPVDGYNAEPWNGVTDYCLYRENGEVLAVVEAKKTAVDVRQAEAQLEYYVKEIEKHQSFRPFGSLANGYEIRDGLAGEMKNKSSREDPLVIDYLRDFIAVRGYIMLTQRGEQMYVEEYRRLVEKRILDLVANHPTV